MDTNTPSTTNRLLTTEELAIFLGVNCDTIRRYANSGAIPSFRFGKDWRFDPTAVLASAAFGTQESADV